MAAIVAITFFVNNRTLQPDIMESRNLVTAREMVVTGNWLVPTMNGELRLEKPPLPTWISAVVESVSPDDIAAQRAVASLFGVMLVVFFFLLCRDVLKVDPVIAVILLCTCYQFMLMARTVSWDIYTHGFMLGGIYFYAMALLRPGRQLGRFCLAGVFTGLSIMSKGPVSLFALFLPFIIAFAWAERPSMRGKWGGIAMLAAVALAVGGWWYAYIQLFHSQEWSAVMAKETGSWLNRNVRPWYYYWKFFLEAGVWSLLLVTATIIVAVKGWRTNRRRLTAVAWMLICLVLLSCMPEKKTRYLLPLLIPAAVVMAQMVTLWAQSFGTASDAPDYLPRYQGRPLRRWPFRVNCWLLAAVIFAIPAVAYSLALSKGLMTLPAWIAVAAASLGAAWLTGIDAVRLRPRGMAITVGAYFAALVLFAFPVVGRFINNDTMDSIGVAVNAPELLQYPLYSPAGEELRIEMVYQARRDIRPLDIRNADSVAARLPLILLTHGHAGDEVAAEVFEKADTVALGEFDCNRRPKGTKRYSPLFIYHLTLLQPKENVSTTERNF